MMNLEIKNLVKIKLLKIIQSGHLQHSAEQLFMVDLDGWVNEKV